MANTAIFFGSSSGNTETVANEIAEKLDAQVFNVADNPAEELNNFSNLLFGTSTWGVGDLQDDWESFLSEVENADLNGKNVALFGCGDGASYSDTFVDGMGTIYAAIKDKGCKVLGFTKTDGYDFEDSTAVVDGKFVGLPIDEDNQSDLTNERIEAWVEQIKQELS